MSLEIRPIGPDELVGWTRAMGRSYSFAADPEGVAAFRRGRLQPEDAGRSLGAFDGAIAVGTFRSFPTPLTLPGGSTVPVAAITQVGVVPTHRRRGALSAMMAADLRADAERGEVAAILIASEYPIYGRYGFGPATEHATLTIDRAQARFSAPVADPGSIDWLEPAAAAGPLAEVFEAHRRSQPGEIHRRSYRWEVDVGLVAFPGQPPWTGFIVIHRRADDAPDGFLRYHVDETHDGRRSTSVLVVDELLAADPLAEASLWRFALDVDLVASVRAADRRVDEPIVWRLADARAARQTDRADFVWLRPLDLVALLEARRYLVTGRVILEVVDPGGPVAGRYALEVGPDGARCRPTRATPGLRIPVAALGSVVLGGVPVRRLADAGRVEVLEPPALAVADAAFAWPVEPWSATWF